jgi:hypothetical protein
MTDRVRELHDLAKLLLAKMVRTPLRPPCDPSFIRLRVIAGPNSKTHR